MNLGDNSNFFRESFRGFNKDDVAEYIAKLSRDYTANEEKYKEHIMKLIAELKVKTDEIVKLESELNSQAAAVTDSSSDETEQRFKDEISVLTKDLNGKDEVINTANEIIQQNNDEINRLTRELNEKDAAINALQAQLDSGINASYDSREEIEKYKEAMDGLSQEIEEFKGKCEALASETTILRSEPKIDKEAVNQLSLQLAESESERMYLFNIVKKFMVALDFESSKGIDIKNAADITDIAPKSEIAGAIESKLGGISGLKDALVELEAENAVLKENLDKTHVDAPTEEQMYKSVMAKLGETVYSANKLADDTLTKAQSEADNIIDAAKKESLAIIDEANAKSAAIDEADKEKMAKIREKYALLKSEHEQMYKKYKQISEEYEFQLAEVEDTVNTIHAGVNREDF